MTLISFLWRSSKKEMMISAAASFISGIATTGLIAFIHHALTMTGSAGTRIMISFIGLCVITLVAGVISQILLLNISQGAIYNLRLKLSRQILGTPLRELERLGPARLLTSLTDDIAVLSFGLLGIPIIGVQVMIAMGCLAYLGWLSLPILGVVMVFLSLAMLSYWFPATRAIRRLELARDQQDQMFKHFTAITQGTKELKINAPRREAFFETLFEPTADRYRRQNIIGFSIYSGAMNWGYLTFFLLIGFVIFTLPGYMNIDRSLLTGSTLILLYLRSPIELIFSYVPELGRSQIALKKLKDLGLTLGDRPLFQKGVGEKGDGPHTHHARIQLSAVAYNFHQDEKHSFQLGPLDMTFEQGESVFIIGGNGSGKSTLVKLITGLYTPESGTIYWNQNPVTERNREDYRQNFAAVFSDYYLFESLLGIPAEDLDEKAKEFLIRLQLNHKVQINKGTLSTLDLSQGQRKRLSLLTAFLENRPFYIFDEWAADQDPYFKEIFYKQIIPELKRRGKGIICITHDEKYFDHADRIIKLDYGRVEEYQLLRRTALRFCS